MDSNVASNLEIVRQKIKAAALAAGRAPDSIKLIAVSKGFDELHVRAAIKAGQDVFGENRVQEAKLKFAALRKIHAPLELHMIGHLQTNKAEDAVKIFDVIQTLDRPKLAEALAAAMKKTGRAPQLYAEVNLGFEPQKSGVAPQDLDMFLKFCRDSCGLKIEGLMCIPPQTDEPAIHFARLKSLADKHRLPRVSMGMSNDFENAVRCGTTDIRIGTAIFGGRVKPQA